MFVYGAICERKNLKVRHFQLPLPGWPSTRTGYRIALLADFHVQNLDTAELASQAIHRAIAEQPDMIVLAGDFVDDWFPSLPPLLGDVLAPLHQMKGRVVAIPGNHDYFSAPPDALATICDELGILLLRNSCEVLDGICWVGVDSYQARASKPDEAMNAAQAIGADLPKVVLWHEPDAVDFLPTGANLMLSGHSHGGQFVLPGGWAPKHSTMGRKYVRGFYPHAKTPIFVTSGVGTTFLPSRFNCPPEVAILTLNPA